jgi:hypothetical protein
MLQILSKNKKKRKRVGASKKVTNVSMHHENDRKDYFQCPQLYWCCFGCLPSLPNTHFVNIVVLHNLVGCPHPSAKLIFTRHVLGDIHLKVKSLLWIIATLTWITKLKTENTRWRVSCFFIHSNDAPKDFISWQFFTNKTHNKTSMLRIFQIKV